MKVTVFGGSGFLGSHVADALTSQGHDVLIFDKNESPYLKPDQKMMLGDILDVKAVKGAVNDVDIVYNFIALADIDATRDMPVETAQVNIIGNINVLEACKEAGVSRFVFSSSIYVYSDQGSFYRSSKQSSELFIENYQKVYDLDYTILRYGSLYGPRSDENNWVYRMLKQAMVEHKITREGDGEEIREYIHIQDAARLSVDILDEKYKNQRVIIAGNEQMKIKDLMTMVQEILKGKVELEYVDAAHSEHYEITPYVFNPQVATRIRKMDYLDMGQGILNILSDIYKEHQKQQNKPLETSDIYQTS